MALTNWDDTILLWAGPRNNANQGPLRPLGLVGLRQHPNWGVNALSADSFAFQWGSQSFLSPSLLDTTPEITSLGEWKNPIQAYQSARLPDTISLTRSYYFPPHEGFYIVAYTLSNPSNDNTEVNLFDYLISETTACGSQQSGNYDVSGGMFYIDGSACGQGYLGVSGKDMSGYSIGPATGNQSPLSQFQQTQSLNNNSKYQANQISIGVTYKIALAPSQTKVLVSYRALQQQYSNLQAVLQRANSQLPEYWISQTGASYQQWLKKGIQPQLDSKTAQFYQNSLILMKNSLNPVTGTFVASFHPAYDYKNWGRDGAFNAMALDAAGYHEEAEAHFKWLAKAQMRDDGAFHTCYDWFTGNPVGFVEPQYDSAGAFLLGVYHHYALTKNVQFLMEVYPKILFLENFYLQNIPKSPLKLTPPDYSIWEESSDPTTGNPLPTSYFTFTQSMAFAGIYSASKVEGLLGNTTQQNLLSTLSNTLRDSVEQNLWNENEGHYYRSIWSDSMKPDNRLDSSSVGVIFSGLATNRTRAISHLSKITGRLTKLQYGLARYEGDIFFYASKFNPGGKETTGPEPAWGVVTMFAAWAEYYLGIDFTPRLNWMMQVSADGLLPIGEALDSITGEHVMSSCPDIYEHAAVYVWGTLISQKLAIGPNPTTF
uniref:GH15-like domain-containing protein n=1 Tax=Arcella intermedia TaxID=1963864 RepID=A0A6B2KZQ9_9EUKA